MFIPVRETVPKIFYVKGTSVTTNVLENRGYHCHRLTQGEQMPTSVQWRSWRPPRCLFPRSEPNVGHQASPECLRAACIPSSLSELAAAFISPRHKPAAPQPQPPEPPATLPAQALCGSPFPPARPQLPQLPNVPLGKQQFFSEIINFSCCPDAADVGLRALLDWSPVTGADRFFAPDRADGLTR